MALQFFDGFEGGDAFSKPEWGGLPGSVSNGRDGAAQGGRGVSGQLGFTLPTPAATVIWGCALMYTDGRFLTQAGLNTLWTLRIGATDHLVLHLNGSGLLELRLSTASGTLLRTGTTVFPINTWMQIQLKANVHLTAGSCEVRVNGVTEFTYTGQTGTATGNVSALIFTAPAFWDQFDDFYVCDGVDATATQGRPNNDFLGDVKVVTLVASGAGASTTWTPTVAPNWNTVKEVIPNTTDYVATAAGTGLQDFYAMTDLAANANSVIAMRPVLYTQKSDAGTGVIKPLIRQPDGTVITGTGLAQSTAWNKLIPSSTFTKTDGSLWSPADVNNMQLGVESA
jgi:hypothetical protein